MLVEIVLEKSPSDTIALMPIVLVDEKFSIASFLSYTYLTIGTITRPTRHNVPVSAFIVMYLVRFIPRSQSVCCLANAS